MADFNFVQDLNEGSNFAIPLENTVFDGMVVSWSTSDGTAVAAGGDYVPTQSPPLSIAQGDSITINVHANDDGLAEPEENFHLFLSITATASGVNSTTTFDYTFRIPPSSGNPTANTIFDISGAIADATVNAFKIGNSVNQTFEIVNTEFGLFKNVTETAWPSTSGALSTFANNFGTIADSLKAASAAWDAYEISGPSAALSTGAQKLLIAAASGEAGEIVATGVGTFVTFFVGGTLAPVIIGAAAGYVAGQGVEWAMETGFESILGPHLLEITSAQELFALDAAVGDAFGPYTLGQAPPPPAWQYDVDSQTFTWLSPPSDATLSQLRSQLGFESNALVLTGDAEADKADVILGGFGNDTIRGLTADDVLFGKDGNDRIEGGDGNDVLDGGNGNDTVDGGAGVDTADYSSTSAGVAINLQNGAGSDGNGFTDVFMGIENVVATNFADIVIGNGQANHLRAFGSNDTLIGLDGDDVLDGGAGSDALLGVEGNDVLIGGDGVDILIGGGGSDSIDGGAGDDTIYFDSADVAVLGGTGFDVAIGTGAGVTLNNMGGSSIEGAVGTGFADTFNAAASTSTVLLIGNGGADTMTGGTGDDTIYFDALDTVQGLTGYDVAIALGNTGVLVTMTTQGLDLAIGTEQADTFNAFAVGPGGVVIYGQGGNDTIGEDDHSNDYLHGGTGTDQVLYVGNVENYTITQFAGGTWIIQVGGFTDTLVSIEQVHFANTTVLMGLP